MIRVGGHTKAAYFLPALARYNGETVACACMLFAVTVPRCNRDATRLANSRSADRPVQGGDNRLPLRGIEPAIASGPPARIIQAIGEKFHEGVVSVTVNRKLRRLFSA